MTRRPSRLGLCGLAAAALLTGGCKGCKGSGVPVPAPTESASASAPPSPEAPKTVVLTDLVTALPGCEIDHHGPLFDVGTDAMIGRYGFGRGVPPGVAMVEHDGSTWARLTDRKFQVTFTLVAPTRVFVGARAAAYGARSASVAIDDQPLGTLTFNRTQIRIATTGATNLPVDAGLHTLTFRFFGRPKDGDAFADIDWIRVGFPDDTSSTYGPPTLRDVVAPAAALAGVPHRSLALRAPGSVRCALRPPKDARLRTSVGVQGAGEGEAEIRVLRDGHKPESLRVVHLDGTEKATWTDLELPVGSFGPGVFSIELRANKAPKGGRVLFGDPAIVLPPVAAPVPPKTRAVVVVVLDGVTRADLPPWNPAPLATLPALTDLAATGTTFEQHRAPTTIISAAFASLLTGLPPVAHGLTDASARLPDGRPTLGTVAREASVRTAMFTGVPYSFKAFGTSRGWERFVEHSPSSGDLATAPIDDATAFVTEIAKGPASARLLIVVHARGGHPPWDVTAKELSTAVPSEYGGLIEPRRAAESIARLRKSKHKVITDGDRQVIGTLSALGLSGQDRALGGLVASLRAAGLWDSTLFMVTGDVSSGAGELFADGLDLKEPPLTLPLYVHFPGGRMGGKRVGAPTEIADLSHTALSALGLSFAKHPYGRDLGRIAAGLEGTPEPQIATMETRYAARWGDLVLSGRYPKAPELCDLSLDPTCAFNRRDQAPIAVAAMFRSVVALDVATQAADARREPATLDPDTAAALRVFGAIDY